MLIYYNKEDLVKFGNYLLSEEREQSEKDFVKFCNYLLSKEREQRVYQSYLEELRNGVENPLPTGDRLSRVTHADIENWKNEITKK